MAATGLLAQLLCLAPSLLVGARLEGGSGPVGLALSVLGASLLRFPDRLQWTTLLCFGAVGSLAATRLADRLKRPPWPLLAMAFFDAFGVLRMPWRQQVTPAGVPSAYTAHAGPVLDLWPEEVSPAPAWTLRTTNLDCYYQTGHGRPIADLCVTSPGTVNPRLRLGQWVSGRLLAGAPQEVAERLGAFGFATVALHPDFFTPKDRAALQAGLAAIDPNPVDSTDGGGHVRAYRIPAVSGATPAASWASWPGRLAGGAPPSP